MTNRARDWEPVQDSIHEMVRRIAAQFHPDKIILFGSHSRGDARPDSDVDFLAKMGWGRILNRAWRPRRNDVIRRAHLEYGYSLAEIGRADGFHSSTISRLMNP